MSSTHNVGVSKEYDVNTVDERQSSNKDCQEREDGGQINERRARPHLDGTTICAGQSTELHARIGQLSCLYTHTRISHGDGS